MEAEGGHHGVAGGPADKSVTELVTRISEQASSLVREEIELAKAEIELKAKRIAAGAVIGIVAGFLVLLALIYAFQAIAWGLNDILDELWVGFAIVTGLLLLLALIGSLVAFRSVKAGSPPTPERAIEEAKLIRKALESPEARTDRS